MLSPKSRRNIGRILPVGLIWLLFSFIYTQLEKGLLGNLDYYPATGNPYNFSRNIFITPLSALLMGLIIGAIETLYINKLLIRKSLSKKIIYKSAIYLAFILSFLALLTAFANAIELQNPIFSKAVWNNVFSFFADYAFISVIVYIASIIVVSQFYMEVNDNIGQAVLANFFMGKYHRPAEEERIFMFLDMKSSTTIAEQLGHLTYFEMLKEYYADLTESVINYSGEIYQYVGDEMVVSWKLQKGLQNNNCLQCFLSMKAALLAQAGKYHAKFGVSPSFKAGFHAGKVTTGEIGIIKKDIIFTGDVLNTASRIQGLCNTYNVDILISGVLAAKCFPAQQYYLKALDVAELRGRGEKMELFTLVQY
ncbi:adenylate/guanylate cyclase domain-containing protein [Foetidibacter luteolus]|uniref:adenylate/guanylate cyclase domain-containing protein n=1 Tax=Foetidibacter luteolus TaxID=2608880 RepID=UPI00129BFDCE|nr:adenylate/guanylate cyclase domain-containing protein [Foetidibacter luteolus]